MKDRIRAVREKLNISQTKFGEKIGISRDTVANIESGRIEIKDIYVKSICNEFSVNEEWLRTGQGKMEIDRTRNQIITDFAADLINEPDSFKTRLIEGMAKLDISDWEEIERIVLKITNKNG